MFQVNEVILFENKKYRILAILTNEIVWIAIDTDTSLPSLINKHELVSEVENGNLIRTSDPYQNIVFATPKPGATSQIKRDENYELIKSLINNDQFFIPKIRSSIIEKIIASKGSTKQTLYRLARRYWQRGLCANALIPDYRNSGAKGSKRKKTDKKIGRPRKNMPGIGENIDEHTEKLFRSVINKYLLTEKKHSFSYAHRKFQSIFKNYYPNTPETEIPTSWQLKHFYDREYNQVDHIQKRHNKIDYKKDIRPLKSTSNTQVLGPGSRFEIDATIADIYLVSDSDRQNIVGRPIIYFVIDVFSRMVAGFYIGFESPSYVAAIQALTMAMTDKVAYCTQFGFEITFDQWPITGLPDAILADRGELLGHQIEALERNFSVRIENTPPYRGDAKGIVERYFKTAQADFKPFATGVVEGFKEKKRGGNDYPLDAKLTIRDFTEIILGAVLYRNQFQVLAKYDRDIDIPATLPLIPLALWNWGLQHRTGRLRSVPEEALRINLLPRTKVTISNLGICAFGIYYTSAEIIQQGWLHRTKGSSRPKSLEVAYDPRNANKIYIFPQKNSAHFWVCALSPRSREFEDCSFWDVWQVQQEQKNTTANHKVISEKKRRQLEEQIESKIKEANQLQTLTPLLSKAKRISSIRKNRSDAKQQERMQPFNSIGTKQGSYHSQPKAQIIQIPKQHTNTVKNHQANEDPRYPSFIAELFDEEDNK